MSVPVFPIHVRGGSAARAWAGRRVVVLLLLVLAGLVPVAAAACPPVAEVDARVELQVGEVTVSRYLVEKNLARFREEFLRRTKQEAPAHELARWLERFVAQQGLIAAALRDGYGARPEATAMVERMERHMLTNPDGPFYAWLLDDSDDPDADVVRTLPIDLRARTVAWARFRDLAQAHAVLGADFSSLAAAGKLERLAALERTSPPFVRSFRGDAGWPWEPFPELAPVFAETAVGSVSGFAPVAHGVVVVGVLSAAEPMGSMQPPAPAPALVRRVQLRALRHRRIHRLLEETRTAVDPSALAELWAQLSRAGLRGGVIPESALGDCAGLPLVRREAMNGSPAPAALPSTAADWQRYFNRLLMRRLPRDAEDLRESVEAMIVEECDLRAARAAGVDATAKFRGDRENFLRGQALELFLRERFPARPTSAGAGSVAVATASTPVVPDEAQELVRGWAALREFDAVSAAQDFLVRWRSSVGAEVKPDHATLPSGRESLSPHSAEVRNPKNIP